MKYLMILIIVLICACVCEMIRELHTFRVTHYDMVSEKLSNTMPELKVVLLSDLHNNSYGFENTKLVKAIEEECPDLILVAGDMLVGKKDVSPEVAESFLKRIAHIAPIYYGNGNHEQRMKECTSVYGDVFQIYKQKLLEERIVFLENSSEQFQWYGETITISGLEASLGCYKKLTEEHLRYLEIEEKLGKSDEEHFQVLIAHNPVYGELYAKWGADLTVSGHLHGGIVRLPFIGGLITPQVRLFPRYSGGQYAVGERMLVVSKGLGTHTFPIRLFNEAEVVVIHIKGRKKR